MIERDALELIEKYKKYPDTCLSDWVWYYADCYYAGKTLKHFIYRIILSKKVIKLLTSK